MRNILLINHLVVPFSKSRFSTVSQSFILVVLAFTGAPASFPVQAENRNLHQYLVWNTNIKNQAINFIRSTLPVGPFIGIHLRNGVDWVNSLKYRIFV